MGNGSCTFNPPPHSAFAPESASAGRVRHILAREFLTVARSTNHAQKEIQGPCGSRGPGESQRLSPAFLTQLSKPRRRRQQVFNRIPQLDPAARVDQRSEEHT